MKRQERYLEAVENGSPLIKIKKDVTIQVKQLNVWYHRSHVLKDISTAFYANSITGIIGPSGSGKTTLIRTLNRINDETDGFRFSGEVFFKDKNIYSPDVVVHDIRKKIGMIFQKPCIFPKSIFENVLFGVRHHRKLTKDVEYEIVEKNLKAVSLWNEVSGRLHDRASTLSLGQQQRLCIARTLTIKPEVILMDEPTSALDPVSTLAIEELIRTLKEEYSIIFVSHNMEQVKRISDNVIFLCDGSFVEQGDTKRLFSTPLKRKTHDYIKWNVCEC